MAVMYSITVGFSPILYCQLLLPPLGSPNKSYVRVFVLIYSLMFPPERFDIFLSLIRMLRRFQCVQIFLLTVLLEGLVSERSPSVQVPLPNKRHT